MPDRDHDRDAERRDQANEAEAPEEPGRVGRAPDLGEPVCPRRGSQQGQGGHDEQPDGGRPQRSGQWPAAEHVEPRLELAGLDGGHERGQERDPPGALGRIGHVARNPRPAVVERDQCRGQQDLDVAREDSLGKGRPHEEERPHGDREPEGPERPAGKGDEHGDPRHVHDDPRQQGERRDQRQDVGRVEERGQHRAGREVGGDVRRSARQPTVGRLERDVDVTGEVVGAVVPRERPGADEGDDGQQREPQEVVGRRADLQDAGPTRAAGGVAAGDGAHALILAAALGHLRTFPLPAPASKGRADLPSCRRSRSAGSLALDSLPLDVGREPIDSAR